MTYCHSTLKGVVFSIVFLDVFVADNYFRLSYYYLTCSHVILSQKCKNFTKDFERKITGDGKKKYTSHINIIASFMQTALDPPFGGGPLDSGKLCVLLAPTDLDLNSIPDTFSVVGANCLPSTSSHPFCDRRLSEQTVFALTHMCEFDLQFMYHGRCL